MQWVLPQSHHLIHRILWLFGLLGLLGLFKVDILVLFAYYFSFSSLAFSGLIDLDSK